jgi:hypothetical protein
VLVVTMEAIATASGDRLQITICDKELVAQGDWATVYRGKLEPDQQVVAIKEIRETKQYKVMVFVVLTHGSIERWRSLGNYRLTRALSNFNISQLNPSQMMTMLVYLPSTWIIYLPPSKT